MIWKDTALSAVAKRSFKLPIDRWERGIYGNSNSQRCHPWDMVSGTHLKLITRSMIMGHKANLFHLDRSGSTKGQPS